MKTLGPDNKTMDLEPDSNESLNVGLDPEKTLDFALFKFANDLFMNPIDSHESMVMLLHGMEVAWESDKVKKLPPLDVIIYKDLVPRGWSWDRLLPWMCGSVLFEDYFNYLEEYFFQNFGEFCDSLNLYAAATECIAGETQLTTTLTGHAGLVTGHPDLHNISTEITHAAQKITDSNPDSRPIVPVQSAVLAACFRCIAEEAKLMSGLAECISAADKSMAELWQWKFEFSMKVRKAALDILTTYKGPYFRQVCASMLGMKKEATIASELLNIEVEDCEDKMYNSEIIRNGLLELFYIIRDYFPHESSIKYYPIDSAYTTMASEQRWLRLLESSKESRSAYVPFPVNNDEDVKTPITPKSDASATSLP